MNTCIFSGNLGKDPEARYLPNGSMLTKFAVAVKEYYKSKEGERQESTTWVDFTAFGGMAETITKILKKGSKVVVTARYTKETKDTPEGKRTYHNFVVEGFELVAGGRSKDEIVDTGAETDDVDENIPF